MKKAGQLLAVLTAASVLLSGCEKLKDVTTTSVYVSKNGVVTEAIVEDYSKDDDYTEDELKVFVEDDIKKFTEERGDADSVKLEKCQIKEDKVEIRMEYGDYQSYADYHGAEFFAGTLDEAEEAGYDFSASFVDSKGNEVSVEDAVKGVKHVRVIVCKGKNTGDTAGEWTTKSTESASASSSEQTKTEETEQEYEQDVLLASPVIVVYGK